jgi:hypothetical protein
MFCFVRIVTIHIFYNNSITGENSYSKLYLVDLAGSEGSITEDDSGERVTDLLHVMKSLSAYVILMHFPPSLSKLHTHTHTHFCLNFY